MTCSKRMCLDHAADHEVANPTHKCDPLITAHGECKPHGEPLKYYCVACDKLICGDCMLVTHKVHDIKSFKEVTQEKVTAARRMAKAAGTR